jgi:acetylornithine deacetylase/succinyl-diaminopimelate desuccinylase-like protein
MKISWEEVKNEAAELLQKLIQFDTSNPPGNEIGAALFLADVAKQNGLTARVIETSPQRGNVLISYNNTFSSPLILLSHLDVVGANREEWEVDPFAGVIRDGVLWGRGTIDTKQLTIMELMVLLLLKRNQVELPNDIILMATADEESGSQYGLLKLLEEYDFIFKDAFVINEGGGFPIMVNHVPVYLCETGQKGMCQIRFRVKKPDSVNPYYFDNHVYVTSTELVKRITGCKWSGKIPDTTLSLLTQLLGLCGFTGEIDSPIEEKLNYLTPYISPLLVNLFKAMTENTMAVTIWNGGRRNKTLQGDSEVLVDCRILPGVTREEVEDKISEMVNGLEVEWEIESFREGYETNFVSTLFCSFNRVIEANIPGSILVPFISTGGSDSRLVSTHGANVYGFSPMLPDMTFERVLQLVHGVNERIPLDSLLFGIKVLYESIQYFYSKEGNEWPMKSTR